MLIHKRSLLASAAAIALCPLVRCDGGGIAAQASARSPGGAQTRAAAAAATAFLETLSDAQRLAVRLPMPEPSRATAAHFKGGLRGDVDMIGERYGRAMWSNFPVSDVPRPGLRLGSLNDMQRRAVMSLLRVLLSEMGYRKVLDIMGSDQALADGGTPYVSGRAAYTLAVFGTPGLDSLWMVQFGGHHLALNIAMLGEHAVLAPVLTGCLPAIYTEGGKRTRTLAAENDKAFALLETLGNAQREQAIIDHPVTELALGPGRDGETVRPAGVKASALDQRQRDMLFDLVLEWAGLLNAAHAAPRLSEIKDGLDDTYFAWSGPTVREPDRNGASYFRVQGPRLFIEFSPQAPGGDLTMHVHTIYRDPVNAYGRALT